ncbi:MAG: DNA replication/repair protein RecF [Bdellovibrionales bacterium]|jgi:DNA replication and repair protein RecF|nr:DNA replication/repair protein RecF [Bdellovibrionales bacterium]MBT3525502.1 DNA replication/repair protein RecF [Bdellovibrionales bacterium]MBT7670415.1 DNA replication/repair protein RecF [Bdellovibrionales bacterium]
MALFLNKIQLTNFRNLERDIVTLSPKINCIFGGNGNGKTNLLEGIHFSLLGKSFRKGSTFSQMLSINNENSEISFNLRLDEIRPNSESNPISLTGKIDQKGVQKFLNGSPFKGKLDFSAVFIGPFDSYNFHQLAKFRRHWFDHHLGMIDSQYRLTLKEYQVALKFRNGLLKKKPSQYRQQIAAVDPKIAEVTLQLIALKQSLLGEINQYCNSTFQKLFSEKHQLTINLESQFVSSDYHEIINALSDNLPIDEVRGHTTIGAHRDDYLFLFDNFNSYDFCSLGQQKMSYLSLMFAYIELFRYKCGAYPVVLIDDVSGELDRNRWHQLVKYLESSQFQVLITTANEEFLQELTRIVDASMIKISDGGVVTV